MINSQLIIESGRTKQIVIKSIDYPFNDMFFTWFLRAQVYDEKYYRINI